MSPLSFSYENFLLYDFPVIMFTRQANKMNFTFHEISPYTLSSTIELSLEFDVTDCHDQCVSSELSTAETYTCAMCSR